MQPPGAGLVLEAAAPQPPPAVTRVLLPPVPTPDLLEARQHPRRETPLLENDVPAQLRGPHLRALRLPPEEDRVTQRGPEPPLEPPRHARGRAEPPFGPRPQLHLVHRRAPRLPPVLAQPVLAPNPLQL